MIVAKDDSEKTTEKILWLIKENPEITNKELADACGTTEDGVYRNTLPVKTNVETQCITSLQGGGERGIHVYYLIYILHLQVSTLSYCI